MENRIPIKDLLNPEINQRHLKDIQNYFENGGTWKDLMGLNETSMNMQYKIAYDLYHAADFKKSASVFSYLTVLNPYDYNYWLGHAVSKQSDKLYEEAIVSYSVAEAIDPENPLPTYHIAQCYYLLGLTELAIENLNKTINAANNEEKYREIGERARVVLKKLIKK